MVPGLFHRSGAYSFHERLAPWADNLRQLISDRLDEIAAAHWNVAVLVLVIFNHFLGPRLRRELDLAEPAAETSLYKEKGRWPVHARRYWARTCGLGGQTSRPQLITGDHDNFRGSQTMASIAKDCPGWDARRRRSTPSASEQHEATRPSARRSQSADGSFANEGYVACCLRIRLKLRWLRDPPHPSYPRLRLEPTILLEFVLLFREISSGRFSKIRKAFVSQPKDIKARLIPSNQFLVGELTPAALRKPGLMTGARASVRKPMVPCP